jgi:hypothetical protein
MIEQVTIEEQCRSDGPHGFIMANGRKRAIGVQKPKKRERAIQP